MYVLNQSALADTNSIIIILVFPGILKCRWINTYKPADKMWLLLPRLQFSKDVFKAIRIRVLLLALPIARKSLYSNFIQYNQAKIESPASLSMVRKIIITNHYLWCKWRSTVNHCPQTHITYFMQIYIYLF